MYMCVGSTTEQGYKAGIHVTDLSALSRNEMLSFCFCLVKRKHYISFVALPLMTYTFFTSLDEINVSIILKT